MFGAYYLINLTYTLYIYIIYIYILHIYIYYMYMKLENKKQTNISENEIWNLSPLKQ